MNAATRSRVREQVLLEGVIRNLARRWVLSPSQATAIARRSWILAEERGGCVASRGSRLAGIMLLAYGSVKLALRRASGEERVVRLLSAAQTFGEATALLGKPCPYDAIALSDCKIAVIPAAAVLGLMDNDARFARRIALLLAERNHDLMGELESATLLRSAERLASFLASLSDGNADGAYTVSLPVSKTLLAARLGMKKETLSRLLRQLATERVIEAVSQREVRIIDALRLAELARTS